MYRRGQITTFVLLGLFILFIFFFGFWFFQSQNAEISLSPSVGAVHTFVEQCLAQIAQEGLDFISLHGGYYNLNHASMSVSGLHNTAYYFANTQQIAPGIEVVAQETCDYIDDQLHFCLQNFIAFDELDFQVTADSSSSTCTLSSSSLIVETKMSVRIQSDSVQQQLRDFSTRIDSSIGEMVKLAGDFALSQEVAPSRFCFSCLSTFTDREIKAEILNGGEGDLFIILSKNESGERFIYAHKYGLVCPTYDSDFPDTAHCLEERIDELINERSLELHLEPIPTQEAPVGELFELQVEASGLNVTFKDYSPLFDIAENGLISFEPTEEQRGEHPVWIEATDFQKTTRYVSFKLEVVEP